MTTETEYEDFWKQTYLNALQEQEPNPEEAADIAIAALYDRTTHGFEKVAKKTLETVKAAMVEAALKSSYPSPVNDECPSPFEMY